MGGGPNPLREFQKKGNGVGPFTTPARERSSPLPKIDPQATVLSGTARGVKRGSEKGGHKARQANKRKKMKLGAGSCVKDRDLGNL